MTLAAVGMTANVGISEGLCEALHRKKPSEPAFFSSFAVKLFAEHFYLLNKK